VENKSLNLKDLIKEELKEILNSNPKVRDYIVESVGLINHGPTEPLDEVKDWMDGLPQFMWKKVTNLWGKGRLAESVKYLREVDGKDNVLSKWTDQELQNYLLENDPDDFADMGTRW